MKPLLPIAVALSSLLGLAGCATSPEPSPEMEKITNQQAEIETLKTQQAALEAQVQTLQPDVAKLVSMENELAMLIQEAEETRKKNEMDALEEKRRVHEARPFFMLQIAALDSLDNVKKDWEAQQALYPELLNDLVARSQKAKVGEKYYYRLKVGEFDQESDALEACQALISQQGSCFVVDNEGTKL